MREKFVGVVIATCRDGDGARAEVFGAGDVVGRVADDDELCGREFEIESAIDARGSQSGKVAAVVRIVAERARELKEIVQADDAHLEVRGEFDVARQKRVQVTGVRARRRKNFMRAWQGIEKILFHSSDTFQLLHVSRSQLMQSRADLLGRKIFIAQSFSDNLQIRHAGDAHLVETPRRSKHRFEQRHGVRLERTFTRRAHERPVNVPEQNAK